MAHLTQYSSSVPVIKFNIDQTLMTIGQNLEMDICIPEDGVADNHASFEAIKQDDSYRFVVISAEDDTSIELNGESVTTAEVKDGDWILIGEVEFQFTDDGVYDIKNNGNTVSAVVTELKSQPKVAIKETIEVSTTADDSKTMSTQEFLRSSRMGRRITAAS